MTDKDFFLDKIKVNAPHAYEFSKKHYDAIRIETAGRNLDRKEFCLRIEGGVIFTKEMLKELSSIEDFEYIYVSQYETRVQFKTDIPFKK